MLTLHYSHDSGEPVRCSYSIHCIDSEASASSSEVQCLPRSLCSILRTGGGGGGGGGGHGVNGYAD